MTKNIKINATRYHDICMGHRVVGHEGKCRHLHGHNYRFTFTCEASQLDEVGRVVDFSVIKSTLCEWLEENWDHKMLLWVEDPLLPQLVEMSEVGSVVTLNKNPTAENIGEYLISVVAPSVLPSNIKLIKVVVEETRKCSAEIYT